MKKKELMISYFGLGLSYIMVGYSLMEAIYWLGAGLIGLGAVMPYIMRYVGDNNSKSVCLFFPNVCRLFSRWTNTFFSWILFLEEKGD